MAFGLPTAQRDQWMLLFIVAAGAGGYGFWSKIAGPNSARIESTRVEIDSLRAIVEKAKRDLASGTVEDLRRKVDDYRGTLVLMRRLVPEKNEVPALIDDISTKAKVRGVNVGRFEPLPVDQGQPFDTYRYRLDVSGHFDQVGEFLADIASLPRVVVPQELALKPAQAQTQKLLSDTLGALLEATFTIKTFVKAPAAPGPAGGRKTPAKPPGAPGANR